MEFTDNKLGKAVVVAVNGRIDNTSAQLFETHCNTLVAKGEKIFIFDFEELRFLSSAGLRVIISLAKQLKAQGGKLVFSGLSGTVREIFAISGFDSMFTLHADLEAAVRDAV
jgi:anti-anti-sigma factor